MQWNKMVRTTDMHTAGEPLRIIESVFPPINIEGNSILDKQAYIRENEDWLRKLVIDEPRGHRDMYAALVITSDNLDQHDFGVIFMHNEGYSSMCGHGVIALARYAKDKRLVDVHSDSPNIFRIMCPCGLVVTKLEQIDDIDVTSFVSVPSFVSHRNIRCPLSNNSNTCINVSIAFGGAYYAIINAAELDKRVTKENIYSIIELTGKIKNHLMSTVTFDHPEGDKRLEYLYGVILYELENESQQKPLYKLLAMYANCAIDRSPCGSGVTALITALYAESQQQSLFRQPVRFQNSLLGDKSKFSAFIKEDVIVPFKSGAEKEGVKVELSGTAFYTGQHEFYTERNDPLKDGFQMYL